MADEKEERILTIAREVLGRTDIGADDDLFECGATSLSFVRVLARVHQELRVMVPVAALDGIATPRNIAAKVDTALLQTTASSIGA